MSGGRPAERSDRRRRRLGRVGQDGGRRAQIRITWNLERVMMMEDLRAASDDVVM